MDTQCSSIPAITLTLAPTVVILLLHLPLPVDGRRRNWQVGGGVVLATMHAMIVDHRPHIPAMSRGAWPHTSSPTTLACYTVVLIVVVVVKYSTLDCGGIDVAVDNTTSECTTKTLILIVTFCFFVATVTCAVLPNRVMFFFSRLERSFLRLA